MIETSEFAPRLLAWFDRHGRHGLPWQHPRTPYRAWVAEIMLQQTQVATVIPYFERFVARFPDIATLAAAADDDVLAHWSGLGYYARARNLLRAARCCVEQHGGALPDSIDALSALPGIGRSTAAAILAQAHGSRHAILDGNVRRLLCRLFAIDGWPGTAAVEKKLWPLAERLLPDRRMTDYTQALMDFGATQCSRASPACAICPFERDCLARRLGRVAELPAPRPARALPERDCVMLLIEDEAGAVLLQRRPPSGIWGGLWALPEFADLAGARRAFPLATGSEHWLPPLLHVFSHFRLRIQPVRCLLGSAERVRDNGESLRWAGPGELASLGLPAPVRRLLQEYLAAQASPG